MADRLRRATALIAGLVTLTTMVATGCTAGSHASTPATDAGTTTTPTSRRAADLTLIEQRIAAVNKTAGGRVGAQRAALQKAVVPTQAERQRECPAATQTLSLQPVYSSLRRVSAATSNGPAPAGARGYLLPALIEIYLGDRIVGADMTTLRLWIVDGSARTAVMCVA